MQLLSGMASYYHIREMALDDNWHRRDQERNVFLFSEDNNPSSGTFWVGRNDPAPGPVNWRSLPLAGRLLFRLLSFPQSVQVGGLAAVLPVAGMPLHPSQSDQVVERPLDR